MSLAEKNENGDGVVMRCQVLVKRICNAVCFVGGFSYADDCVVEG